MGLFTLSKSKYLFVGIVMLLVLRVFDISAQNKDLRQDLISVIRHEDEVAASRVNEELGYLITQKDTLEILDICQFLDNEKLTNDSLTQNQTIILDSYLSLLYYSVRRYDDVIPLLENCYDKKRYLGKDATISILNLLINTYVELQMYEQGRDLSRKLLRNLNYSNKYQGYYLLAKCEYNLNETRSAYTHIKSAYNNINRNVDICLLYIDIIEQLYLNEIHNNHYGKAIRLYEEKLDVITANSQFDLTLYSDESADISMIETAINGGLNIDAAIAFAEKIISLIAEDYSTNLEYQLGNCSINDYKAIISLDLGIKALDANIISAADVYFEYAYRIATTEPILSEIYANIIEWYSHYRAVVKHDYQMIFDFYYKLIVESISNGDRSLVTSHFLKICDYYNDAIHFLKYLYNEDTNKDVLVVPIDNVRPILRIWYEIINSINSAYGENYFKDLPLNYTGVYNDYYSLCETDVLYVLTFIYEGNYDEFTKELDAFRHKYHLSDAQILDLIYIICDNLCRHNAFSSGRDFINYINRSAYYRELEEWTTYSNTLNTYVTDWVNSNIAIAQMWSGDGYYGGAIQKIDDVLSVLDGKNNIDDIYIHTLNAKASIAANHSDYRTAINIYSLSDSLSITSGNASVKTQIETKSGLSYLYLLNEEYHKAILSARQAESYILSLSQINPDFDTVSHLCMMYCVQGYAYMKLNQFDDSESVILKAYDLSSELSNEEILRDILYGLLALAYHQHIVSGDTNFDDKCIDLCNRCLDECNEPIEKVNYYIILGNIYSSFNIYKSIENYLLACSEQLSIDNQLSDRAVQIVGPAYELMYNRIWNCISDNLFIQSTNDTYETYVSSIELMLTFLNSLYDKYGELIFVKLEDFNEPVAGTDGLYHTTLTSLTRQIDPIVTCGYFKILMDISFGNLRNYNEELTLLAEILNNNSLNISPKHTFNSILLNVSNTLLFHGYYQHSKDLLINNFSDDPILNEQIVTKLISDAYTFHDWNFAISLLNVNAALIHNDKSGFEYYKKYWDINMLVRQLLILHSIQQTYHDNKCNDYLEIIDRLVESNCIGMNGDAIGSEVISEYYNTIGCNSDTVEKAIECFGKADRYSTSQNKAQYKINSALSYLDNCEIEKSDSIISGVINRRDNTTSNELYQAYKCKLRVLLQRDTSLESNDIARKLLNAAIDDFNNYSKSNSNISLANYWHIGYSDLLEFITTVDAKLSSHAEISYDAALYQKGLLVKAHNFKRDNVQECRDSLLMECYNKYSRALLERSDSLYFYENEMLYLYSMHPEFEEGNITLSWHAVQKQLGSNDLAIEFSKYKYGNTLRYVAIILKKEMDFPMMVELCKEDDLKTIFAKGPDLYKNNNEAYSLIWKQLEPYLKKVDNIYFAAHGLIHQINIELLQSEDGKPMNKKFNIYRVSSTGSIVSKNNISNSYDSAVLFGGLNYDADTTSLVTINDRYLKSTISRHFTIEGMSATRLKFTPLDGAREEVERIIQVLRENHVNAVIYTDSEGTEESFKSLSGNSPSIIHIATHGFYLEDKDAIKQEFYSSLYDSNKYISPLKRCGLAFSGSQHAWLGKDIPETIEDGILTAEEIVGLNLTDTELLVLSACQTGLGHINDEGVEGLQKGFKMAGVKTIIMSLWEVSDAATEVMMTKFYSLLANGSSKREAFDAAIEAVKKEYESPEYWAAFIMLD